MVLCVIDMPNTYIFREDLVDELWIVITHQSFIARDF